MKYLGGRTKRYSQGMGAMRYLGGRKKPYSRGMGEAEFENDLSITPPGQEWIQENYSELQPAYADPQMVTPDTGEVVEDYSQVQTMAVRVDSPSLMASTEKMGDELLRNQVSIIKNQLQTAGLDQALNDLGLTIKFEDLTYERAKTALALFGIYKLLQSRKTAPAVVIAAAGYLYLFMTKGKRVEAKVDTLSTGLSQSEQASLGSLSNITRKYSQPFY